MVRLYLSLTVPLSYFLFLLSPSLSLSLSLSVSFSPSLSVSFSPSLFLRSFLCFWSSSPLLTRSSRPLPGWFTPHPPPFGPYFWPCLPPGYKLVPLDGNQFPTSDSVLEGDNVSISKRKRGDDETEEQVSTTSATTPAGKDKSKKDTKKVKSGTSS